jgi:hypothetical protein
MEIKLEIKKIFVLHRPNSTDHLYLYTELPPTVWPFKESPTLQMEVVWGKGREYAAKNFPGIPIEYVDTEEEIRARESKELNPCGLCGDPSADHGGLGHSHLFEPSKESCFEASEARAQAGMSDAEYFEHLGTHVGGRSDE